MTYQELYSIVKERFQTNESTLKRFAHIESVIRMSEALNEHHQFHLDEEKLKTAALLHDYGKQVHKDDLKEEIIKIIPTLAKTDYPEEILNIPPIWHSFVGAKWAIRDFGISDPDIIEAIQYHSTGKPNMGLLAKVIYVADTIEESRTYPDVEYYRTLAFQNFNKAFLEIIEVTFTTIKRKGNSLHPLTQDTFQYYIKEYMND